MFGYEFLAVVNEASEGKGLANAAGLGSYHLANTAWTQADDLTRLWLRRDRQSG